jgi:hypothetical protein
VRVFVSGPFSGPNTRENIDRAALAMVELIHAGHQAFCPHLADYADEVGRIYGMPVEYERWIEWCIAWVDACDAVLVLAPSPGSDREVARARELGLPVYTSVADVPCPPDVWDGLAAHALAEYKAGNTVPLREALTDDALYEAVTKARPEMYGVSVDGEPIASTRVERPSGAVWTFTIPEGDEY